MQAGFRSVAMPLIGAGTGGGAPQAVEAILTDQLRQVAFDGEVLVVRSTLPARG